MPKVGAKITLFLCLALIPLCGGRAMAAVPDRLLTGAMANFSPAAPERPAPEIHFVDLAGTEMTLQAFRGKVVVLNLWATWCGPCRHEMPSLDRLEAKLGGPGFAVVALSADRQGPDVVPPFYREIGVTHLEVYNDRTMKSVRAFAAPGLPTTIVVGADGLEKGRLIGPAEWDSPEALALLRYVLDQARPEDPVIKASTGG